MQELSLYSYLALNQSITHPPPSNSEVKLSDVSSFFVDSDNSVLFADIPGYIEGNHGIKAKSSSTKSVSLESLIDRDKAVERTYKSGLHLLQIPFKANDYSDYAYVGADTGTYVSKDSLSVVKKFIIVAEDPDGTVDTYVATMISRPEYLDIKEEQDISYLFLGNFSGLILESKLDGELICATYSENGQVFNTAILKEGETKPDNCETFVLGLPVYTKGDADWRLRITTPAECIAYRNTETAGPLPPGGEDEETGQKKFSPQVMYVNAEDTKEADELLRDHMDDSQVDWEIKSIAETKVLAVLEYK